MRQLIKILLPIVITVGLAIVFVVIAFDRPAGNRLADFDVSASNNSCQSQFDSRGNVGISYSRADDCNVEFTAKSRLLIENIDRIDMKYLVAENIIKDDLVNIEVFGPNWKLISKNNYRISSGMDSIPVDLPQQFNGEISVIRFIFYRSAFTDPAEIDIRSLQFSSDNSPSWFSVVPQIANKFVTAGAMIKVGLISFAYYFSRALNIPVLLNTILGLSGILVCFLSGWIMARRLFHQSEFLPAVLAALLLGLAQLTLTMLALSLFHLMFAGPVLGLNLACLVFLIIRYRYRFSWSRALLPVQGLLQKARKNLFVFLGVTMVAGLLLITLIQALNAAPFGYDALAYHLPMAVEWSESGQVFPISLSSFLSYMPGGAELLMSYIIMAFRSDLLTSLIQLPFLIITALAVYQIVRNLGVRRVGAMIGALLVFCIPVFIKETQRAYIDLIFMALVMLALNYGIQFWRRLDRASLLLGAITVGLAIGMRYTAWHFLLPILILYLVAMIRFVRQKASSRLFHFIKLLLIFIGAVLIFGGYWYIRNWIITGNPIYPSALAPGGFTLFDSGVSTSYANFLSSMTIFPNFGDINWTAHREAILTAFGAPFLWAMMIILIGGLVGNFIVKNTWSEKILRLFLILLPIYSIFIFTTIPFSSIINQSMRYVFVFVPLTAAVLGFIAGWHKVFTWLAGLSVLGLLISSFWPLALFDKNNTINFPFSGTKLLVILLVVAWLLFLFWPILNKIMANRWGKNILLIAILIGSLGFIVGFTNDYQINKYSWYQSNYYQVGQAANWIDQNADGEGINLIGIDRPYPFYGRNFKNKIYQLNSNSDRDLLYHEYRRPFKEDWRDYGQLNVRLTRSGPNDDSPLHLKLNFYSTDDKNNYVQLGSLSGEITVGTNDFSLDLAELSARDRVVIMEWQMTGLGDSDELKIDELVLTDRSSKSPNFPEDLAILPNTWEVGGEWQNSDSVYYATLDRDYLLRVDSPAGDNDTGRSGYIKAYFNTNEFGHIYENPNKEIWLRNLKENDIRFVVSTYSSTGNERPEMQWIGQQPDIFSEVYSNDMIKIFRIDWPN